MDQKTKAAAPATITGRDGYIMAKALAYAIETIEGLPERWQETSDCNDMKRLLASIGYWGEQAEDFRAEVRRRMQGARSRSENLAKS